MNNYYEKYKGSKRGFDEFHNEVINMPRADFSSVGYEHLKLISNYLLFFDDQKGNQEYYNYKEIYSFLLESYKTGNLNINESFEKKYFAPFVNTSLSRAYGDAGIGRLFRHEMGIASFFDLFEGKSRQRKRVNREKCKEFIVTPDNLLPDLKRNIILSVQVNTNTYIKELKGINKNIDTDYKPSYEILRYIDKIDRPVTDFELSVFFGRIDEYNSSEEILERALEFGSKLPSKREEQIKYFFDYMNWINADGDYFSYSNSQEPFFKFKVFLLYMTEFGLLEESELYYTLTDYSILLLNDDLDPYLLDLNNLLEKIDNIENPKEIINAVLNSRTLTLEHLLETENDLVEKLGRRSISEHKARLRNSSNPKVTRNSLIMFFAKHLMENRCLITTSFKEGFIEHHYNSTTFISTSGKYYTEGHHILELSKDLGPDIIENIILIDPNTHKLIHNSEEDGVRKFYKKLREDGIITINKFVEMIERYNCLDKSHIDILLSRDVIDREGYIYLMTLINDESTKIY